MVHAVDGGCRRSRRRVGRRRRRAGPAAGFKRAHQMHSTAMRYRRRLLVLSFVGWAGPRGGFLRTQVHRSARPL